MKSIISSDRKCFICGSGRNLELHHCLHGPNRRLADEDGLTVYLCRNCHYALHSSPEGRELDLYCQRKAEEAWIKKRAHTEQSRNSLIDQFRQRYGKNFI